MHIVTLGLNHQTAPVEVRERLAFKGEDLPAALRRLKDEADLSEALILSTCNRVELCGISQKLDLCREKMIRFLEHYHQIMAHSFADKLYFHKDADAIRHGFRVASSLDSMVVGEPQILGQLKDAFFIASESCSTGLILNRFMHRSFFIAKEVRTKTRIASCAVSVSFAAVELAKKIFGDLKGMKVMLIGAGEMCELAARHFVNQGIDQVLVTNRTLSRAQELADEFSGIALPFDKFRDHLDQVDIILSSTGSPTYLLAPPELAKALKKRRNRPIFLIDIAVPRDIDPQINALDNIYLYDVDDLQETVTENLDQRQQEALRAETMVDLEVDKFEQWLASLAVTPTIRELRDQIRKISEQELHKTLSGFPDLSDKERRRLEAMVNAIGNKFLHHPINYLKSSNQCDENVPATTIRKIFHLTENELE
ncbi:MAG: glutamyl-tRNA reductase [Deltaproteobacteria bacterium]|nr:glutamyl-tRNA reductase [Deltaproteobacteria bacterium]